MLYILAKFLPFILAKSLIYTETQHPDSYARIQEIEALKPLPAEVTEPETQVCLTINFI